MLYLKNGVYADVGSSISTSGSTAKALAIQTFFLILINLRQIFSLSFASSNSAAPIRLFQLFHQADLSLYHE